jgi:hypothetical protein
MTNRISIDRLTLTTASAMTQEEQLRSQIARTTASRSEPFAFLYTPPSSPSRLTLPPVPVQTKAFRPGCAFALSLLAALIAGALIVGAAWLFCGWQYLSR